MFEPTITSGFEEDAQNITKFSYSFSQQDSLLFEDDAPFTIQLNVFTEGGTRHTSHLLNGNNGIQYLRDVMTHTELKINNQPVNCLINSYGETAVFTIGAEGVMEYIWQQSLDLTTWTPITGTNNPKFSVIATQEKLNYYYRCVIRGTSGTELESNSVQIEIRGDN